ncbi:hypothetical protein ACIBKZ_15595 [Streptomyces sp. NPDC050421]|uniref:hypothetical protein n=1 Tax=Streptomyces sp. NPDC050421 TaxID=3365613 RepID=UPI00378AFBFE
MADIWFKGGETYGESDLARYNTLWTGDANGAHLIVGRLSYALNSNQAARTVSVGAGRHFLYNGTGGYTACEVTKSTAVPIPVASATNPRRDLIVARKTSTGVAVTLVAGTPAASPVAPARPADSIALGYVDVPKSLTSFTITPTRYTGEFRDQLLTPAPGVFAVDWAGELPTSSAFRDGATVYDLGTNQSWVKQQGGAWHTNDPGPWYSITFQSYLSPGDITTTPSGDLYIRESSTCWQIAGNVTLTPANLTPNGLRIIGTYPAQITRPAINSYDVVGQSYTGANGGWGRLGLMASGTIEYGAAPDVSLGNLYINAVFHKTPKTAP